MPLIFEKSNYEDNDTLLKEIKGLETLKTNLLKIEKNYIKVPEIYSFSKELIKMQKIDTTYPTLENMKKFAISLASLHKLKFEDYGLEYDNFIGLGIQKNRLSKNWGEFFVDYRLKEQVLFIKENKYGNIFLAILDKNRDKLINFLNENTKYPSILHGDLWSGNVLFSKNDIYLIDPALYFGDSEVDIAMTQMFGGFNGVFYKTYDEQKALSSNFEKKKIIYNLYHYLNHYNLFGNSYLNAVVSSFDFIKTI